MVERVAQAVLPQVARAVRASRVAIRPFQQVLPFSRHSAAVAAHLGQTQARQTQAAQVADSRRLVQLAQVRRQRAAVLALRQPLTVDVVPTRSLRLVTRSVPSTAAARVEVRPTHRLMVSVAVRCSAVAVAVTVEAKQRARRSLRLRAVALK